MSDIAQVKDIVPRIQYTASAGQTVFVYPFPIFDEGDIVVEQNGTVLTLSTDYTVSGVAAEDGGNITLTSGATSGDIMTIYRDMALERLIDYQQNGDFLSDSVNRDFDRLWLAMQQLQGGAINGEGLGRAWRASPDDTLTDSEMVIAAPATRAGKFVSFDGSGKFSYSDLNISSAEFKFYDTLALAQADASITSGQFFSIGGRFGTGLGGEGSYLAGTFSPINNGSIVDLPSSGLQGKLIAPLSFQNVKNYGAVGDGSDATAAIKAIKDQGLAAYFPDGNYVDTRNGEFYLYDSTQEQIGGDHRYAKGGTLDLTQDPRPVLMVEKTMNTPKVDALGSFDSGVFYGQVNKKGGDAFVVGITGYVRSIEGAGDSIGIHGRALGSDPGVSEIFGGWSYAFANPSDGSFIFEAIGHEIDVRNSGDPAPFENRTLPPGSPRGDYRGLVIVTADGSNSCNAAIDVGRQVTTSSDGWNTGLRLREEGIVPSDLNGDNTAQARIQGAAVSGDAYGGITFDFGNLVYGIDFTGSTFRNNDAIKLGDGQAIVYSTGPLVAGTKLITARSDRAEFGLPAQLPSHTVGALPTAANAGSMIFVTDETGGAVPAFSDGTNWRRVTDRAIVS